MKKILFILVILLFSFLPIVLAADDAEIKVAGLELEEVINLGSALLATGLFIVTFKAYKRTNNTRLKYVSFAFFLFAMNMYFSAIELIGVELDWFDPISSVFNFVILFSFFYGVVKK